jgi:hypothetical protein
MILGRHQQPHTPFVPVVAPPHEGWEQVNVTPLFGATDDLVTTDEETKARRRTLLVFGLSGVALASIVSGGIMALALRSYGRSGSVVGPALYVGFGSAAVGAAALLIASRAATGEIDPRVAALAVGTMAA